MAEIHVEKKPRTGWIWLLILLIVVVAVAGWLYWVGGRKDAPATSTSPATVTESLAESSDPLAA